MQPIKEMAVEQRQAVLQTLNEQFNSIKTQSLDLDMTRGKPSPEQLDLANELLSNQEYITAQGTDCRNYGGLDGLPEMKDLFARILDTDPANIIVGGNSSLTLMFDALARLCLFGKTSKSTPWQSETKQFLCPSPGYDRHFTITETLGFELISVEMTDQGPNMEQVEHLVANDSTIKGIWCVPKYSNPTGITYSDETVKRLAKMPCVAHDFTIMWDNAYAEHHINGSLDSLTDIIEACRNAGNDDRPYVFASTSKMSFAGSGVSCFASSPNNIAFAKSKISAQSIGPDKLNQLRHIKLFNNLDTLRTHMKGHAAILKPKFDQVESVLSDQLGSAEVAHWSRPNGGYFTSLDMNIGSAKRAVSLSKELGVKLTGAGAPFPYGKDPLDRNIRIAPSFPTVDEIKVATEVLALCVKIAAVEASLEHQ